MSSAEPEDLWVDIIRRGGAAYGLSLDMPAYSEAGSEEQFRALVRYLKSLCAERGWPPGELNFPRPFLAEKAYPENEWVIVAHGDAQAFIYERRFGRRLQLEAEARTALDGMDKPFTGVTAAAKYNVWHSLPARALASLGVEITPPVGREERWELEPYVAAGVEGPGGFVAQGEVVTVFEEGEGLARTMWRAGVGRPVGRFVPMLEAGLTVPTGGENTLALYPQSWIQLSRLGHVAASVGLEVPVAGPGSRSALLTLFVLWDYGDGGLLRGW